MSELTTLHYMDTYLNDSIHGAHMPPYFWCPLPSPQQAFYCMDPGDDVALTMWSVQLLPLSLWNGMEGIAVWYQYHKEHMCVWTHAFFLFWRLCVWCKVSVLFLKASVLDVYDEICSLVFYLYFPKWIFYAF